MASENKTSGGGGGGGMLVVEMPELGGMVLTPAQIAAMMEPVPARHRPPPEMKGKIIDPPRRFAPFTICNVCQKDHQGRELKPRAIPGLSYENGLDWVYYACDDNPACVEVVERSLSYHLSKTPVGLPIRLCVASYDNQTHNFKRKSRSKGTIVDGFRLHGFHWNEKHQSLEVIFTHDQFDYLSSTWDDFLALNRDQIRAVGKLPEFTFPKYYPAEAQAKALEQRRLWNLFCMP